MNLTPTKTNKPAMIKNPFCRPRLRPTAAARKSDGVSPMSLLDRLREAVFRLIMISALSKGSNATRRPEPPSDDHYYYPNDHHHTEAVADCIEFIKKSATTDDDTHHSAVIPLPVM
ncbi:hypothetical protein C2S51_032000 [Perilla frutescens var. frutescens]|nr:hypothetical protein C2S51_032000 [Perilla frutescens var. frutescens]